MAYKRSGSKSGLVLFFLILSGIVLGGFLGSLTENIPYISWLNYGYSFGMNNPVEIDLKVIFLKIQLLFDISIASLFGIAISIFVYRKI